MHCDINATTVDSDKLQRLALSQFKIKELISTEVFMGFDTLMIYAIKYRRRRPKLSNKNGLPMMQVQLR